MDSEFPPRPREPFGGLRPEGEPRRRQEGDFVPGPDAKSWRVFFILLGLTVLTTWLAGGLMFSVSLLLILGTHEFGHYWAGRKNRVKTTLPHFIPAPPGIFIFGTFGAFIVIKDPIPNRRVLMEIGAAGPIAGFIVAVPTLILGLFLSGTAPAAADSGQGLAFGSSIILTVFSKLILGVSPLDPNINIQLHPIAFAGWVGMFVTALNLFPIGQLDGGHILSAMFQARYPLFSWGFFLLLLFPLGYFWPGWWFWAIVLFVITRLKPAPLRDDSIPLDRKHRILGYVAVVIFVVTFTPIPFEVI